MAAAPVKFGFNFRPGIRYEVLYKIVVGQSNSLINLKNTKYKLTVFLVFTIFLLFGIIMTTAYKTKLTSIFMRPPHIEPSTFDEVVADGYSIVVGNDRRSLYREIFGDNSTTSFYVNSKSISAVDLCAQIDHVLKYRSAALGAKTTLNYDGMLNCEKEMLPYKKIINRLRFSRPIRSNLAAWAIRKDLQIWKRIDDIFDDLSSGGFIDKWIRDTNLDINIFMEIPYARNNFPEKNEVHFQTYCFLIYFVGKILALLAFLIELAYTKYKSRKRALY